MPVRGRLGSWMLLAALGALLTLVTTPAAFAGEMSLAWDPVSDADLAGYTVYYGTSPSSYTQSKDVGLATQTTLTGLDPCTVYYVAVKAYDEGGLESENYSNEVAGLPRPVVSSVTPASGEQGSALSLTIDGESFDDGASVEFSGDGITVQQVTRVSCFELAVDISIASGATPGARDVTVVNPDGSYGTRADAFTVTENVAPEVSSTSPQAGASGVSVAVEPTVTFSEAMDPATITADNVQLRDGAGQPVPQANGSPSLSADGRTATIDPADPLAYDSDYHIWVDGGSGGVQDESGLAMSEDYSQNPPFTTEAGSGGQGPQVTGATPADGASDVSVDVEPTVTFDEPLDPVSVNPTTVQLVDASGQPVPQASGSPSLSADGLVVTITPAEALEELSVYKIRVRGGDGGVQDEDGNPMADDWSQPNGFETENLPPGVVSNLRRTDTQ
jgi:hypothetical protein